MAPPAVEPGRAGIRGRGTFIRALPFTSRIRRSIEGRRGADALDRLQFLAEAGTQLSASLDFEQTLTNVARQSVPYLADWCIVYVVEEDGTIRRLAMEHADPGDEPVARAVASGFVIDPESKTGVPKVIRTGEPEFAPQATAAMLAGDVVDPKPLRALLEPLGIASWICVPLRTTGPAVGALSLVGTRGRGPYDDADLALAQEVGRRAAIAIENARLYERERTLRARAEASERRLAFLADASALLSSSLDYETTLTRVARLAVPHLADWCAVDVLEPDGRLERLAVAHVDPEKVRLAEEIQRRYPHDPESEFGVWSALRTGKPQLYRVVTDDLLRRGARNEEHLDMLRAIGTTSAILVPLVARGRTLGLLTFSSSESGTHFDETDLALAVEIARHAALAVENSRLYRELQAQTALLDAQGEATIDGILVVAPDGKMISFNQRFIEMWGMPEDVVASRSDERALAAVLDKLVDPDGFLERVFHLYQHPEESSRDEIRLADGRIFDRYSAPAVARDGTHYGRAWYFRDVTEQKRIEADLRARRERAAFLARASEVLAASLDHESVLRRLAPLAVPALADYCVIDVTPSDRERRLRRIAAAHREGESATAVLLAQDPLDWDGARVALSVLRSNRAMLVPGEIEPSTDSPLRSRGMIAVPIAGRQRVLGVISFVRCSDGASYGPADLELAEDLARRVALAVDNARLFSERARVAKTLQDSLLPPHLPDIPHLDVAALYQPAGEGFEVGGDFYDLFATDENDWAIVIGDVCGKGADAAAITALARYTVRAAAIQARKPSRVLALLNEALLRQTDDSQFCTAAYARVRPGPARARVTVSCGGHPLPYVIRPGRRIRRVGRIGTVLGAFGDPRLEEMGFDLRPGDMLVLYTDGVVDARGPEGRFGEERLQAVLESAAGGTPAQVVAAVDRAVGAHQISASDDIAIVAVRARP